MTTQWQGGARGLWKDPDNWTAGLPMAADDLLFDTDAQTTIGLGQDRVAASLSVVGVRLTLHGGLLDLTADGTAPDVSLSARASLTLYHGAWLVAHDVSATRGSNIYVHGTVHADYAKVGVTFYQPYSEFEISGRQAKWVVERQGITVWGSNFALTYGAQLVVGHDADFASTFLDFDYHATGLITGFGTRLEIGNLNVFGHAHTSLLVQHGAEVDVRDAYVGYDGSITVADATFHTSHQLTVYRDRHGAGPAHFTIVGGSVVTVGYGGLALYGTLTIDSSSTLTAPHISSHGGSIVASAGVVTLSPQVLVGSIISDGYDALNLSSDTGATLVLDGTIADGDADPSSLSIAVTAGHVVLAGADAAYTGTTDISGGTLEIAAGRAVGSGGLAFLGAPGTVASLQIDANLPFDNVISGFAGSDAIDLAAFAFAGTDPTLAWSPTTGGGTLTITSSEDLQQLNFAGAGLSLASFHIGSDSMGGTLLTHS